MSAIRAQQEDENESSPTEGMAAGQGWVPSRESFLYSGPTPSVRSGRPPLRWRGFSRERLLWLGFTQK